MGQAANSYLTLACRKSTHFTSLLVGRCGCLGGSVLGPDNHPFLLLSGLELKSSMMPSPFVQLGELLQSRVKSLAEGDNAASIGIEPGDSSAKIRALIHHK